MQVARDMHFEAQGEDLLGGGAHVPVPTFFGRPKWGEVFKNIQSRHSDATVGVFACGPLVGVNQLKAACLTSNKACNRVKFVFHRETF